MICARAHKEMCCCRGKGTQQRSHQLESEICNRLVETINSILMPSLPPHFNCKVKHTPLEYVVRHSKHATKLTREASVGFLPVGLQAGLQEIGTTATNCIPYLPEVLSLLDKQSTCGSRGTSSTGIRRRRRRVLHGKCWRSTIGTNNGVS